MFFTEYFGYHHFDRVYYLQAYAHLHWLRENFDTNSMKLVFLSIILNVEDGG